MTFLPLVPHLLGLPPISILLQALVNQYLSDSYCLTFVLDKPLDFYVNASFTSIFPANGTVDDMMIQLLEVSEKGCSDYIVYMSNPQKFMSAFDQTGHVGNARRSDRKIIVLPFSSDEDYVKKSLELFYMTESSTFVANMLLVLANTQTEINCELFDLVTHMFVSLYEDQPLYLDQWDSCTQKFIKNVNLFPHDLKDLNGRVVRVACFTYKPYTLINVDPAVVLSQRDGVETRIVDEFCRWVNCTIEIVNEEKDQWGEMYENRTGIGILGHLVMDQADMGIGALYPWYEQYLYLDFSAAAIRAAVTCVAPSPRLLASWEMPLMAFSWFMRCAVVVAFIFASIGLMIAKSSTDKVFLTVFGMMISQSQTNDGKLWRVRAITGWILVASLIIVSAYGAGLAATFTVPRYEPSIDTVQDLVDRNMEWGATHDAWIFSLTLSTEPLVKQLVSQFRIYPAEILKKKSFTRNLALSIEKLPAGYFAIGDYVTKEALLDLTLMLEDFYYGQCVVMMRKSSVYTEKISELIGRLHESGILLAWEAQVALKHLNIEVQQAVKLSRSTTSDSGITTALGLNHVGGIFFLYLLGVVLASLIFLGEYFTGKLTRRAAR